MEQREILNIKDNLRARLNTKYPSFDKEWESVVTTLGNDFVSSVKQILQDELVRFKEVSKFRFSIVIDNNFIFGQIKAAVTNQTPIKETFVYNLLNTDYIDIYAPPKLQEELLDKIENIIIKNKDLAKYYSSLLLDKIIIKDAYWIEEWKKANNIIGHMDNDDVPYLALALHTKSHSIISYDKHFKAQENLKCWNIQTTNNIITSYNTGFISFCILGVSMKIIEYFYNIITIVLKVIGDIVMELIRAVGLLIQGSYEMLKKLPSWLIISVLAIGTGAIIFSEDVRARGNELIKKIRGSAQIILQEVKIFILEIIKYLQEFWELFKPTGITGLEFFGYLVMEYRLLKKQVEDLDDTRVQ
ncbi:MAG: hypothetical protein K9I74_00555 [Bacteroidales bacterium]|nr:hypothetical protein [Bacteroidales bacterium]